MIQIKRCWRIFHVEHEHAPLTVAEHWLAGVMPKHLSKKSIERLFVCQLSRALAMWRFHRGLTFGGTTEVPDQHQGKRATPSTASNDDHVPEQGRMVSFFSAAYSSQKRTAILPLRCYNRNQCICHDSMATPKPIRRTEYHADVTRQRY